MVHGVREVGALPGPRRRVDTQLTRPGAEDQPTLLGGGILGVRPSEHIAKKCPRGRRVVGVDERVNRRDHPAESRSDRRPSRGVGKTAAMTRDTTIARQLWQRLELIHAVTYFSPEAVGALRDAGYKGFWMGYFAGRAAPLGPVGPEVVTALFYNFAPSRVARALPDAWNFAPPEAALGARLHGSVAALATLTRRRRCRRGRRPRSTRRRIGAARGSGAVRRQRRAALARRAPRRVVARRNAAPRASRRRPRRRADCRRRRRSRGQRAPLRLGRGAARIHDDRTGLRRRGVGGQRRRVSSSAG